MDFPSSKPPTQLLFTRKLSRLFYWLQRCQKTKKEFFLTLMTGALVIYTTNFQLIQEINDEHFHGLISASPDKKHIVTANSFGEAHLYKEQEGSYSFKGSLAIAGSILAVDITNDLKLVVVESFQLFLFQYESGSFSLTETVAIGQSLNAASIDKSLQNILAINSSGYVFLEQESGRYEICQKLKRIDEIRKKLKGFEQIENYREKKDKQLQEVIENKNHSIVQLQKMIDNFKSEFYLVESDREKQIKKSENYELLIGELRQEIAIKDEIFEKFSQRFTLLNSPKKAEVEKQIDGYLKWISHQENSLPDQLSIDLDSNVEVFLSKENSENEKIQHQHQ